MTVINVAFPVSIPTAEQLGFELCIMSFFKALGMVAPNESYHEGQKVEIVKTETAARMRCDGKEVAIAELQNEKWGINPELVIDQTNWFFPQGKDGGGAPHRRGTNRPERGPWV